MSALDHAFIRAYSKDTNVRARAVDAYVEPVHVEDTPEVESTPRRIVIARNDSEPSEPVVNEHRVPNRNAVSDDNYSGAVWYRGDAPSFVAPKTEIARSPETREQSPSADHPFDERPAQLVAPKPIERSLDKPSNPLLSNESASLFVMPPSVFLSDAAVDELPRPAADKASNAIRAEEPIVFGRIDEAHDAVLPPTHIKLDIQPKASADVRDATPLTCPSTTANEDDDIHVLKMPVKDNPRSEVRVFDESAGSKTNSKTDENSGEEDFNAAWEVSQVVWPAICDQLTADGQVSYAAIREKLQAAAAAGRNVIAITSHRRGEGRTTLALCVARELANDGANVLLIDADFQNPQISSQLNLNIPNSWTEALRDGTSLAETAVRFEDIGLTLLTLNTKRSVNKLTLRDKHIADAIRQTASFFDIVLVDTGPVIDGKPECVDAAIIVCDCRKTTQGHADRITRQLTSVGVEVLGVAKNFDESLNAADMVTV